MRNSTIIKKSNEKNFQKIFSLYMITYRYEFKRPKLTNKKMNASSQKMSPYYGKVQRYITQTTPPIWSRIHVPVAQDLRRDPAVTHVILRSNCNTISPIFHI